MTDKIARARGKRLRRSFTSQINRPTNGLPGLDSNCCNTYLCSVDCIATWLIISLCCFTLSDGSDECSVDVVFLLDSSLSVRQLCPLDSPSRPPPADNWQLVLNFVGEVVDAMPLDRNAARVGVVTFSSTVGDVIPLNDTDGQLSSMLRQRIQSLPFLGRNTNTTGALRMGRHLLAQARETSLAAGTSRKQYAVLLTDGANNVDDDPLKESRLLKQEDVRLIPVGISQYVDEAQLKEMASVPAEYSYIYASDFSHLNLLVDQLLSRINCSIPPPAQRQSLSHATHLTYNV